MFPIEWRVCLSIKPSGEGQIHGPGLVNFYDIEGLMECKEFYRNSKNNGYFICTSVN